MRIVVATLLFAACGPGMVKLEPERVRDVDISLASGGTDLCPAGVIAELRAIVRYKDGRLFETRSHENPSGRLSPRALAWSSSMGIVDPDGRLQLPELVEWHDREVEVSVALPTRPDVFARRTLVPRFECDRVAAHDGAPGFVGSPGGRGADVEVALAYVDTERNGRLVLARLIANGVARYHLIDRRGPSAARFVVSARGGAGGTGESGYDGEDGYDGDDGTDGVDGGTCEDGGDGSDGGAGGDGGDAGDGGPGGNGGDGGTIAIAFPPEFPELARMLEYDVTGGSGGAGGSAGSGGSGGHGGKAGNGGAAGSTIDHDGSHCSTSSGRDGSAGRDGSSGSSGNDGADGYPGENGTISARAAAIDALWAAEIASGWRIVRD